jgi:hypothetical protein
MYYPRCSQKIPDDLILRGKRDAEAKVPLKRANPKECARPGAKEAWQSQESGFGSAKGGKKERQ